jgi:hypothetical protein
MSGTNGDFDADSALWMPGVDYVGGWRDAVEAGAELTSALMAAWPDVRGMSAVARSAPDGSGAVSVQVPPSIARALARLVHAAAEGDGSGRAAS